MEWLGVAEAADVLDVDGRQVRRLLVAGDLAGRRLGRIWLVDAESVRARRRLKCVPGRPLGPARAWAVLEQVGRHLPGPAVAGLRPLPSFPRFDPRRVPPVEQWPSWLRGRARHERIYLHPGLIDRFDRELAVRRVDVATALGSSAAHLVRFVDADELDGLLDRHHAERDPDGQVDVWVVPPLVDPPSDAALLAAALVDLLGSPDAREAHGARVALEEAAAELDVAAP